MACVDSGCWYGERRGWPVGTSQRNAAGPCGRKQGDRGTEAGLDTSRRRQPLVGRSTHTAPSYTVHHLTNRSVITHCRRYHLTETTTNGQTRTHGWGGVTGVCCPLIRKPESGKHDKYKHVPHFLFFFSIFSALVANKAIDWLMCDLRLELPINTIMISSFVRWLLRK